ncbi:MAG: T9SS type A sorting domain-containing protein [Saprospirales bacterium]|nr:T9SS type A sorting domain-containing protein [Saprospirales bacterium]
MKQIILSLSILCLLGMESFALPLPDGANAPNFTMTDLNGTTHTLSNYLAQGKTVIIDFSATWCGPCWNYHNTHILRDLYNQKGPPGTNQVMVFFIEGDPSTPVSALYGGSGSQGNWVAGTPYPIMDDGTGEVAGAYQISYFPTLYAICPDGKVYEPGQVGLQTWINWITSCGMNASASVDDANCFGQPSGSIDLTVNGGYGNKTYQWSTGASTQDVNNLLAGNYAVTVTDGNMRTIAIQNLAVTSPSAIVPQTLSVTNVGCAGGNNGSATVGASGGVPGYVYNWNTGASGPTANNLSAGNYQVTVRDANNCTKVHSVNVTQPQPLNGTSQTTGANCGDNDGLVMITPSGGSYPYSFNIGNGPQPVPVFTGLAAGNYTVTITDSHNCSKLVPFAIPDLPGPVAAAGPPQTIDCANAQVTLDGTGSGSGNNISYQWTTTNGHIVSGATTTTPVVDMPGAYTLTVTNLQTDCANTASVQVSQNTATPVADAGPSAELLCSLPELSLDGTGSSQGAHFQYNWTTNDGNIVSGSNTLEPLVDAPGFYTLTVTNSQNACVSSETVEITADTNTPVALAGPDGTIDCAAPTITLDGNGSSSGAEVTYLWTTTDGTIISGENTLTPVVAAGGSYVLEVTNTANGCVESDETIVSENLAIPTADAGPDGVLNCNVSELSLDGSASSAGLEYTYNWTSPDGHIASGGNTLSPIVDAPGTYNLEVINTANGCVSIAEALVVENQPVEGAVESLTHIACTGDETGSATVTAALGVAPYQYLWPDGATGATHEDLVAGTYNVIVSDSENCEDLIQVVVEEPALLIANASATGETGLGNNDGTATANPAGGVEPFAFSWNNGETTASISGLSPGEYTVVVTDANGCSRQETVTVNSFTCSINASVDALHISCNGAADGAAIVNISEGLEPFSILWSNGSEGAEVSGLEPGVYTVSITDENNCPTTANVTIQEPPVLILTVQEVQDAHCFGEPGGSASVSPTGGAAGYSFLWPSGNTGALENNLAAGEYTVVLTDANGCETSANVEIGEPEPLAGALQVEGLTCAGSEDGEAALSMNGGTAPYDYAWSNGSTGSAQTGLGGGIYEITVQDDHGCTFLASVEVPEPEALSIATLEQNNIECAGQTDGSATVAAAGGTSGYEYAWSSGATGATATDLAPGFHQVLATDANGCTASMEIEIVIQPDNTLPTILIQDIILALDENGNASLSPGMIDAGSFDNCGIQSMQVSQTTFDCSQLGQSEVILTVFDVNGNENSGVANVMVIDEIAPALTCPEDILAFNCDGLVEYALPVAADNCGAPALELTEGLGSGANFPIGSTTETWKAEDASGNFAECAFTVTVVNTLEANATATGSCPGLSQGSAAISVAGGTPGYTYLWSNGGETESITGLPAGAYDVVVKDATGCEFTAQVEVEEFPGVDFVVEEVVDEQNGGQNGAIKVSSLSGTAPFTYEWQDELGDVVSNEEDLENVPAGAYKLFATDANGCTFVSDWIAVQNITGTNEPSWAAGVWVYPNPAKERVNVRIKIEEAATVQLEVFDLKGVSMAKITTDILEQHEREITTGHWASGVYFLRIVVDGDVLMRKLVIE